MDESWIREFNSQEERRQARALVQDFLDGPAHQLAEKIWDAGDLIDPQAASPDPEVQP